MSTNQGPLPKYEIKSREIFVRERYARYLAKKELLDALDPDREKFYLSDLDLVTDGVSLKEIVLCDRCCENIGDPVFVYVEESYVYHHTCCSKDPWFIKPVLPKNVVTISDRSKSAAT